MKKLLKRCIGIVGFVAVTCAMLFMAIWVAGNTVAYAFQTSAAIFFALMAIGTWFLAAYIAFNW